MKSFILLILCIIGTAVCSYGQEQQLDVVWDDGLKFRSPDGAYEIGVGGRFHYDISFLKHDTFLDEPFGTADDQVEVRRARISLEGTIKDAYAYEFEISFEDGLELKNVSFSFLKIPYLEQLTLGHFREPFGMEENTSSNNIPFMERSLTSAFGTSRNAGVMVQHHFFKERVGVYAGAFRITDDFGSDKEAAGKHSFSARTGFVPVRDTTANRAVHIGLGLNTKTPVGNRLEVETQNESNTAPYYISSGVLENIDKVWQIGGEAGLTEGPFTLQGEYIHAFAQSSHGNNLLPAHELQEFISYYLAGSYFLSGGRRSYDTGDNTFSDIRLNKAGAWEVALRYSHINQFDSPQKFSKLSNFTLGLNYYLNTSARLMMNYIFSRIEEEHQAQVLQFRLQVSF